ncbi:MAG: substrate-binding domain-containing protein [Rhodospirillales bacterium]|nr:substrate-binding domain-containing protein [Rhodospirillales bacterium]
MSDRVLAVVRRHHYVSDGLAVGLASRRSRLIGLLIPSVTNSIYASSTQAIHRVAQRAGYTVLVGASDFSPDQEEQLIRKLLERRVEGLILTGETRSTGIYETIQRNGVPFVVTWQLTNAANRPCVSFDNRKAAATAVEHLIGLGHRRIGLICGRSDVNDRALARREAFKECLARHKLALDPDLIFEREFEFVEGSSAMHRMLQHRKRPTAVFCANDIQAIGALYQCRQAGVRVPEEMSIIGFDDLPISQYTTPQLTTIRVPAEEMGRKAAERLLEAVAGDAGPMHIELPTDLIVRQSTCPPRK